MAPKGARSQKAFFRVKIFKFSKPRRRLMAERERITGRSHQVALGVLALDAVVNSLLEPTVPVGSEATFDDYTTAGALTFAAQFLTAVMVLMVFYSLFQQTWQFEIGLFGELFSQFKLFLWVLAIRMLVFFVEKGFRLVRFARRAVYLIIIFEASADTFETRRLPLPPSLLCKKKDRTR
jgi:hypothetical protein